MTGFRQFPLGMFGRALAAMASTLLVALLVAIPAPSAQAESEKAGAEPKPEAPAPRFVVPAGRPAWVEQSEITSGPVQTLVVASEPFVSLAECEAQLDARLARRAAEYIDNLVASPGAAERLNLTPAEIRRRFLRPGDEYSETLAFEFGSMQQAHVRLTFDDEARRALVRQWQQVRAGARLARFGLVAGLALATLLALFAVLRREATEPGTSLPFLRWGTAATILGLAAAGWWAWRFLPGL